MTPTHTPTASVRLADGREATVDDILTMGHPGMVALAGASVIEGAAKQDVADLCALPLTMGDDAMDVALGAYNIAMNADLLDYPDPVAFTDAPAAVIGSGPSLDEAIPQLLETYGRVLLVAAPSACPVLLKHGIIPHVVAPKERVRQPDFCFEGVPGDRVCYGGLTVCPDLHERFTRKWCVGSGDPLTTWALHGRNVAVGPTSGTAAATLALELTTGPVYLVGMDNAGGHYAGYPLDEPAGSDTVLCHDGVERPSQWVYRIARANLQRKAAGRMVQTSPTAAVIPGVPLGFIIPGRIISLPSLPRARRRRKMAFQSILQALPYDWDELFGVTQTASTPADTQLLRIPERNRGLFLAMMSPMLAQLSMERRMGMSDADVMQWYREATRNMIDMLTPTITAMAHAAGIYDG